MTIQDHLGDIRSRECEAEGTADFGNLTLFLFCDLGDGSVAA